MNLLSWQPNHNAHGFSLIEMIIALMISAIIIVLVVEFIITSLHLQNYFSNQSDMLIASRKIVSVLSKQLREVSNGDNGGYPLVTAESYKLAFYSNIDNDAAVEQIQYYITGTNLIRAITKPTGNPLQYNPATTTTTTIATQVTNQTNSTPLFIYFNKDYPIDQTTNPLTTPINLKDVTLIKVSLHINGSTSVETFIQLRNFKTNL
ncbi:MAG: prepilin-type N-terminal cleavage/methylation domain-containing protein [Patescibacteria group bacterium]|jgi:prepilin-type N-terminal cleavage/methylation domain-containing protein